MDLLKNGYYNVEDSHVSEENKNSFGYLRDSVDFYINSLVKEKIRIKKARNLYDGKRDIHEFRYLEETFGIETPIKMKMTSLIKTRIDVLLGILLDDEFTFKVTISDSNTLTKVEDERKTEKLKRILASYDQQLSNSAANVEAGKDVEENTINAKYLKKLRESIDEDFISEFEIAAQSLIKFFEQDITIDLQQKVKQYFLDLLVTGEAYYRTFVERVGEDPVLSIVKAENLFYKKNTNHQYLSTGERPNVTAVVNREFMNRAEILRTYGHAMNETAMKAVFGEVAGGSGRLISNPRHLGRLQTMGDLFQDASHGQFVNDQDEDALPVYHVEWLANNRIEIQDEEYKEGLRQVEDNTTENHHHENYGKDGGSGKPRKYAYRLDRYEGVRIGTDIYVNLGKSKHIPRSESKPWLTTLSYNGIAYNDRNGTPYSIALSLKDLQDSFDVIIFFRDNMIANSGLDGSRINMAAIPKVLGQDYMERILKFIHFRKQGLEFYDPTEDGANLFSGYGDFKGSLSSGALQDLNLVLEAIQAQADMVTGINRHMYAAAEQKDAVTNVKVGQKQVSLITKDLFKLIDVSQKHILTDLINKAKVCYKSGKKGSYILGDRVLLFNVKPNSFCFTDYNIHVINSSKENLKLEKLQAAMPDFVAGNILDPDVLIDVIFSDSPTEIKRIVKKNVLEKKKEMEESSNFEKQLLEATKQLEQMKSELDKSSKQIEAMVKASDELKSREVAVKEGELDYKRRDAEELRALKERKDREESETKKELVRLEREQLYLETDGSAAEIKNNI